MTDLSIERINAERVEEVLDLFDAYRRFYGRPGDRAGARAFLHERLTREESVILLARVSGVPAGFAQLYPTYSSVSMLKAWLLNDLFVDPAHRQHGIGRALLRAVADHARQTDRRRVELETAEDNTAARALYEAEGYRIVPGFLTFHHDIDSGEKGTAP